MRIDIQMPIVLGRTLMTQRIVETERASMNRRDIVMKAFRYRERILPSSWRLRDPVARAGVVENSMGMIGPP